MFDSWFSRFYLVGGWLALLFLDEEEHSGGRVWKQTRKGKEGPEIVLTNVCPVSSLV